MAYHVLLVTPAPVTLLHVVSQPAQLLCVQVTEVCWAAGA